MKPRSRYRKLHYQPNNPKKYIGHYPIECRSSWEIKMAQYLDLNPNVISWASEPFFIPYKFPLDENIHRYFPDYYIKMKTEKGIKELVVEVKPIKETKKPVNSRNKKTKTAKYENEVYIKNQYKWKYASEFCKTRGYEFIIFTEKDLFPNKFKKAQDSKSYSRKKRVK